MLFLSVALAAGTPPLPKLPPRTGDLLSCPAQEVLATRFSTQSDANGGGFGYYVAKYDDQRQAHVVDPSAQWVSDYQNDRASGAIPSIDTKLATLWGLRCAYPELDYVQTAYEAVRAQYLGVTGVTPATELAFHSLLADVHASDTQRAASCPSGDAWHFEDPALFARQVLLCGGMGAGKASGYLLEDLDADPDPIVGAGIVALCPGMLSRDGVGTLQSSSYWTWRVCDRIAAAIPSTALDDALRKAGTSDWVRLSVEVKVEEGRAVIEGARAAMTKLETGWPGLAPMWSASVAQVDAKYAPLLKTWAPTLDTVDPWLVTLHDGPGFATGCEEKWRTPLQQYVSASGVQPKGRALFQVLQEPVAVGLLEALAVCKQQTGDVAFATMAGEDLLSGTVRITRWYHGLVDALGGAAKHDGTFDGKPLPQGLAAGQVGVTFAPDAARGWLRNVSEKPKEPPYSYEETVAGVVKNEDGTVTLSFPKRTGTAAVPTDCATDYSHVDRIDEYGKLWYPIVCKGSKTILTNDTFRPLKVAGWEAVKVAPGMKVAVELTQPGAYYRVGDGGSTPVEGAIVWVKRGEDVVWAGGVGL